MPKPIRSSRRKSSGKRSPSTQELRYLSTDVKGSTDGKVGVSATPTASPKLARRKPRTKAAAHLTRADIEALPADALVAIDGSRQAVIALYDVEFDSVADVVAAMVKRL